MHPALHGMFQQDPATFFAEGCEADVLLVLEDDARSPQSAASDQSENAEASAGAAGAPDPSSPVTGQPVQDATQLSPAAAATAKALTAFRLGANRTLLSVWSPVLKAAINEAALQQQVQGHAAPGSDQELHEGWEKLAEGAVKPPTGSPAATPAATASTSSSSSSDASLDQELLQETLAAVQLQPKPKDQHMKKLVEVRLATASVQERHAWWLAMCLIHPLSPTFGRPPVDLLTPQLLKPLVDIGRRYAMPGLLLAAKGLLLEGRTHFGLGDLAPGQLDAAEWLVTADSIPGYDKVVTRCIEEVVRDCTLPPPPTAPPTSSAGGTAAPQTAATAPAATAAQGGFAFSEPSGPLFRKGVPTGACAAADSAASTPASVFGGAAAAVSSAPATGQAQGFGVFGVPSSSAPAPANAFGAFGAPSSSAFAPATAFGAFGASSSSSAFATATAFGAFGVPSSSATATNAFGCAAAAPPPPFSNLFATPAPAASSAPVAAKVPGATSSSNASTGTAAGAGGSGGAAGASSVLLYTRVEQLQGIVKQLRPETAAQLAAALANCLMVAADKVRAGGGDMGCDFRPTGLKGGWQCVSGGTCSPMER